MIGHTSQRNVSSLSLLLESGPWDSLTKTIQQKLTLGQCPCPDAKKLAASTLKPNHYAVRKPQPPPGRPRWRGTKEQHQVPQT